MEKEFVLVPKEFAERIKSATSDEMVGKIIEEIFEKTRNSMKNDLECLEEDAASFKLMLLKYKKAYKDTLEEHEKSVYELWEELHKTLPNFKKEAEKTTECLNEVENKIKTTQEKLNGMFKMITDINQYKIKELVELLDRIDKCSPEVKKFISSFSSK